MKKRDFSLPGREPRWQPVMMIIPTLIFFLSLISLISLFFLDISPVHASVAIKMSMEPVTPGAQSIKPGDGVRLRFKLVDIDNELIGGIMTDIVFDKDVLSISADRDVKISSVMQNKKTLYTNLSRDNKLRVMLIGFNDRVIPHDTELFTVTFQVIRNPDLLPGTMIYQHASSTSAQGVNVTTIANSLFIPVTDSSSSMSLSSISGTVSESTQGISSTMVGLISSFQPQIFYQTLTDSSGNYSLNNIMEGTYTLVAVKENYGSYLEKKVIFSQGNTLVKNITMSKDQTDFTFISPVTPADGTYYTSGSSIFVSGITSQNTNSVTVQGNRISDYGPGDLIWYTSVPLKIGENIIKASALDKDGKSLGQSAITIAVTSSANFKITAPTENESYQTQSSSLVIGGIVSSSAATIDVNGKNITGYTTGQTSWSTTVNLQQGINFLNCTAKGSSGKVVGTDSIFIFSTGGGGGGGGGSLDIINPAQSGYYQTAQSTITIGGQTPSSTNSLTMNGTSLTGYLAGSESWSTSSISLILGDNTFTFKALDTGGNSLGEATILVQYQPGYVDKTFMIKTPTESSSCTADNQQISLGGDTPSSTSQIRVNGQPVSGYQVGNTAWSTNFSLQSGENQVMVVAYNAQGQEIGSDTIDIFYSQSFGVLSITQPTDAPTYQTKTKTISLGGKTSNDTEEILINGQVLSGYQAKKPAWAYNASIPLGKTTFVVMAYDPNNDILGRDEIMITNPGVLAINRPTTEEDYVTGKKNSI